VKCPQIRITVVEGIYYYEKKPDRPVEYDGLNGMSVFMPPPIFVDAG
jgi:hypothetical protein